jgi:hypothetical protein
MAAPAPQRRSRPAGAPGSRPSTAPTSETPSKKALRPPIEDRARRCLKSRTRQGATAPHPDNALCKTLYKQVPPRSNTGATLQAHAITLLLNRVIRQRLRLPRDHIGFRRPCANIDQATSLRTERPVAALRGPADRLGTRRTRDNAWRRRLGLSHRYSSRFQKLKLPKTKPSGACSHHPTILALMLGPIHGLVGSMNQCLCIVTIYRRHGDTQADRHARDESIKLKT